MSVSRLITAKSKSLGALKFDKFIAQGRASGGTCVYIKDMFSKFDFVLFQFNILSFLDDILSIIKDSKHLLITIFRA